jgi:hypothetical protein
MSVPVHHLDRLVWTSEGRLSERGAFRRRHADILESNAWIVEGLPIPELEFPRDPSEEDTLQERLSAADLIVLLDAPCWVCLYRMLRRKILSVLRPRQPEDLPPGLDYTFNVYVVNLARRFKSRHLPAILARIEAARQASPQTRFLRLRRSEDLTAALACLGSE